ncbi:serine protease 55-like [Phlebotomus argentipes]|uniref:serine protease 55-like n=1 Tax=Phlebotomus argentipes TaxID=94469 RepID=UPI00289379E8|nr:serine protease 55-like [Phlebotomus argentipes]
MKCYGVILLTIFLTLFGNINAWEFEEDAPNNASSGRTLGGYLLPRDSEYKSNSAVLILYYASKTDRDPSFTCTGSIISKKWIISTAFCFDSTERSIDCFEVLITDANGKVHKRTLEVAYAAPGYKKEKLKNNVGLAKVNKPYDLSTGALTAIKAPKESWDKTKFLDDFLSVAGYRDPYTKHSYFDYEPTVVVVSPRDPAVYEPCAAFPKRKNEVCGATADNEKYVVCQGDLGAALYLISKKGEFYLYALASYTLTDKCVGPTAYVVISYFNHWIKSIVHAKGDKF